MKVADWIKNSLVWGGTLFVSAGLISGTAFLTLRFLKTPAAKMTPAAIVSENTQKNQEEKSVEERIRETEERSSRIKGVYMTAVVANDPGKAARRIRESIVDLLETTELNGVVVDVKETDGVFLPESLKSFIDELHGKNIWVIARLVAFNDTVKAKSDPDMALKKTGGGLWLDRRGNAWLDPAHPGAQKHVVDIAKRAIDYGFDEIQFDYIRFPSDGNVASIVYPAFQPKINQKYEVLHQFFRYSNRELKAYKPDIVLSADLFGYVSTQQHDLGIGQRMEDLGDSFDYISFMLYPSHYYSGFQIPADVERGLPALFFPYRSKNSAEVVSNNPYEVVYRSILTASDFLSGKNVFGASTTSPAQLSVASSTAPDKAPPTLNTRSRAKLRPWLQDFDLGVDTSRGIYYTADKVRAQIKAAEDAGAAGWLLWNPANVYTEVALKKE